MKLESEVNVRRRCWCQNILLRGMKPQSQLDNSKERVRAMVQNNKGETTTCPQNRRNVYASLKDPKFGRQYFGSSPQATLRKAHAPI